MNTQKNSKSSRGMLVVVIGLLVIIAGLLIYVVTGIPSKEEQSNAFMPKVEANVVTGEATKESVNAKLAEAQKKVDEGMLGLDISQTFIFPSGTEKGQVFIQNPERNTYPFTVQLVADDTGEIVYTSGLIPVGSRVEEATLDIPLVQGTYSCTAYFTTFDSEGNPVGQTGLNVSVIVQN